MFSDFVSAKQPKQNFFGIATSLHAVLTTCDHLTISIYSRKIPYKTLTVHVNLLRIGILVLKNFLWQKFPTVVLLIATGSIHVMLSCIQITVLLTISKNQGEYCEGTQIYLQEVIGKKSEFLNHSLPATTPFLELSSHSN